MPSLQASIAPAGSQLLQRKCASCGSTHASAQCEKCNKDASPAGVTGLLQRRGAGSPAAGDTAPASVSQTLARAGTPLPAGLRRDMEQRFGHDFSRVRVHDDSEAAASAREVSAQAYTVGHHLVFGQGRFQPAQPAGRQLLAHELTHVVQQSQAPPAAALRLGTPGDAAEREADRNAERIAAGTAPAVPAPLGARRLQAQVLMRAPDPQGSSGEGAGKAAPDAADKALEQAVQNALQAVTDIEANWKSLREPVDSLGLAAWLMQGDNVVKLLREHTQLAVDALRAGDSALYSTFVGVVESDLSMYRYIAWHVAVQANLLDLEPQLIAYQDSFDNDSRSFTGRADAEDHVKLLQKLALYYRSKGPQWLGDISTRPMKIQRNGKVLKELTVTIAAQDAATRKIFDDRTQRAADDQAAMTTLVVSLNGFFATARKEGALQAVEAVVEFLTVRGSKSGPKANKSKKGKDNKGSKKGGRWGCTDVSCNIQQIDKSVNCPARVSGNAPYVFPSQYAACLAAQQDANTKVPQGCYKRHCNCNSKCSKK